jgi:hypothetical protein
VCVYVSVVCASACVCALVCVCVWVVCVWVCGWCVCVWGVCVCMYPLSVPQPVSVRLCVCVRCVYVYVVCAWACVCVSVRLCVCVCMYPCACMHAIIGISGPVFALYDFTCVCSFVECGMCACEHTYAADMKILSTYVDCILFFCVALVSCLCVHTHKNSVLSEHVCANRWMQKHTYIHTYIHAHLYARIHTYMQARSKYFLGWMFWCRNIHTCTHIYIHADQIEVCVGLNVLM